MPDTIFITRESDKPNDIRVWGVEVAHSTQYTRTDTIKLWNTRAESKRITDLLNANNKLVERARRAEHINRELLEALETVVQADENNSLDRLDFAPIYAAITKAKGE